MSDKLVLIMPECDECGVSTRLKSVLDHALADRPVEYIRTATDLVPLRDRKLLFVIQLDASGINPEYYKMLRKIRLDRNFFDGCLGGLIVDGVTEGFTKAVSREVVLSANLAGCAFLGRPLVEATGSLSNFKIQAANLNTDLIGAYLRAAKILVDRLIEGQEFERKEKPRLLVFDNV